MNYTVKFCGGTKKARLALFDDGSEERRPHSGKALDASPRHQLSHVADITRVHINTAPQFPCSVGYSGSLARDSVIESAAAPHENQR